MQDPADDPRRIKVLRLRLISLQVAELEDSRSDGCRYGRREGCPAHHCPGTLFLASNGFDCDGQFTFSERLGEVGSADRLYRNAWSAEDETCVTEGGRIGVCRLAPAVHRVYRKNPGFSRRITYHTLGSVVVPCRCDHDDIAAQRNLDGAAKLCRVLIKPDRERNNVYIPSFYRVLNGLPQSLLVGLDHQMRQKVRLRARSLTSATRTYARASL